MPTVFVYGTLKGGQRLNHILGDSQLIGPATIAPDFVLYEFPYTYPALIDAPGSGVRVKGELYRVTADTLQRLDYLEGYPRHYQRDYVATDNPKHPQAIVYFMQTPPCGMVKFDGDEWDYEESSRRASARIAAIASQNAPALGTPISELSGRPGHPGYSEFCRIAESWGHE